MKFPIVKPLESFYTGKKAVVVGRSNIVGMPAALLLNKRDATVTICHSATKASDGDHSMP